MQEGSRRACRGLDELAVGFRFKDTQLSCLGQLSRQSELGLEATVQKQKDTTGRNAIALGISGQVLLPVQPRQWYTYFICLRHGEKGSV